jgi:hypothetical protein
MDMLLAAALKYAASGWAVFPLLPREKRPWPGTHGFWDASTCEDTVLDFWLHRPYSNVGVATGASGLLVLDVDGEPGEVGLVALQQPLPPTREQRTGRGRQLFFLRPAGSRIGNSAGKLGPALDVRGQGGYVVVPPSIHPTGKIYEWVVPDAAVAPAPQWLIVLLEPPPPPERTGHVAAYTGAVSVYAQKALDAELASLAATPQGQRNEALNMAAFSLGQLIGGGELSEIHVAGALRLVALSIGLDDGEIQATIRSGFKAGAHQPRSSQHGR